jgi:hypothetical protein
VNAAAFTLGDNIIVGAGVDLASMAGGHILGHELAHSVQSRLGGSGSGRLSSPDWATEREAERAAAAARAGEPASITEQGDGDVNRVPVWLILAGIGLVAGLVIWAASDSPEENQKRHAAGAPNASEEIWALIPVYGSIQQIREADSYFQRVLGVGFLMLDCATLGSAGVAGRALLKAPGSLIRSAIARRAAGGLAVREGGEILTEAAAKETAATFTREGGALLASQAAASDEMLAALSRGSLVVVAEGGLNHSVIYAKNAAGQIMRVHGGPMRVLFQEVPRELSAKTTQSMARRVNAYLVIEGAEGSAALEQAIAKVSDSGPAALRWLGGNPTSCGIVQSALLEAGNLSTETLTKIVPRGGASARMLPISLIDTAATSGAGLRFVEGGMTRIIGGTLLQGGLLGAGGAIGPVTSSLTRFIVNEALEPGPPEQEGAQAVGRPGGRTVASDNAAIAIVQRFGRAPAGPNQVIRNALPDIVPGWLVSSPAFHESVKLSLIHLGMDEPTAAEIVK